MTIDYMDEAVRSMTRSERQVVRNLKGEISRGSNRWTDTAGCPCLPMIIRTTRRPSETDYTRSYLRLKAFPDGRPSRAMGSQVPEFSLPNAAVGPNPFSLSALPDCVEFVVLFFQRDHYCTNCREQVQEIADRYDAFRARNTEVVSIVPEPFDKVEAWQDSYDLPYPLLADTDAAVGDAYGQPVRHSGEDQ